MSSKLARRLLLSLAAACALPACGNINDGHPAVPFTVRASVSSQGLQGFGKSEEAAVSGNGRYVVFTSFAPNLVQPGPANVSQVYRRDLETGITEEVSLDPTLNPGDDSSSRPAISLDGRFVAFQSFATNLLGGNELVPQVYIRDMNAPAATAMSIVSQDALGNPGDDFSSGPSISADGRFVAFESFATNFGDTHISGLFKIYRKDLVSGEVIPISVTPAGDDPTAGTFTSDGSITPSISADGSVIAFASDCVDVIAGDINDKYDVFIATVGIGGTITTVLASRKTAGGVANGDSQNPALSGDGQVVAFHSRATNLIPLDANSGFFDVFAYHAIGDTVTLVSRNSEGFQAAGQSDSFHPSISADGRYIAFDSPAPNLYPGDTNLINDVYIHDTLTGITDRVSVDSSGNQGGVDQGSFFPSISADGRVVAFVSEASFAKDDTNGQLDVYVRYPLR